MEDFKGINLCAGKQSVSSIFGNDGKDDFKVVFNKKEDNNFAYSTYDHFETEVIKNTKKGEIICKNVKSTYEIMVEKIKEKKLGVLIVGIGGNNATTMLGGICANSYNHSYINKYDIKKPNYLGSIFLSSNMRLGYDKEKREHTYCPIHKLTEIFNPENIIYGGWDINNLNIKDCLVRNKVFETDLVEKIKHHLDYIPLKSVYFKGNFIAPNQQKRVNNLLTGNNKLDILNKVRNQIKNFKKVNNLSDIIILWSGNTEKNIPYIEGVNDTFENLLHACKDNHTSVSPSIIYALAAVLENCPFINSSPQNTLVNAIVQLAQQKGVFIIGNDLKTGQTKIKNFLLDFYFGTGKPSREARWQPSPRIAATAADSCHHRTPRHTTALHRAPPFPLQGSSRRASKKISKSNLICDYVKANEHMYVEDNVKNALSFQEEQYCKGDSLVDCTTENDDMQDEYAYAEMIEKQKVNSEIVIKYVPYVGDDKKAIDEYISEIFMNGKNTISIYNVCQDSLLASPILIDLILLVELAQRVYFKTDTSNQRKDSIEKTTLSNCIKVDDGYELHHDILKEKHANFKRMDSVLFLSSLFCKSPFNSEVYKTRHSFFSQMEILGVLSKICLKEEKREGEGEEEEEEGEGGGVNRAFHLTNLSFLYLFNLCPSI
ncbi:myo-inositol 1-phosphate synthase [Plasmodium ovale wallikeri]|uniref:inositol-3-phosphate synthase n=1 Tax=Plasmodium ovale wallikeri TaxID=864142 RepID=A0A1A8YYY7_PLAOA|nr:myo-inositol 1-phosphate synthase [Plasmodium ovale wallikeri]SBT36818.1 myo-inositol 1-phosphate synthase [Plasmodium ovale wallikeri]